VVPGLGPVDSSEIVKGYEYQKGRYVTVEPDDLKKLPARDDRYDPRHDRHGGRSFSSIWTLMMI
jgi:hypothetical protein